MGSTSGGSGKAPRMPTPSGPVAPYGETSKFNPSYVNFLPDAVGEDGRMPMASGLDESHLAAIRGRVDPMEQMAKDRAAAATTDPGMLNRDTFAQMMAQFEQDRFKENYLNGALRAMNPGGPRGVRNKGGDSGGYTSSRGGRQ